MKTDHLIDTLAEDLTPLEPLSAPWLRATWWLLGAVAYLGLLTWMKSVPADGGWSRGEWPFVFSQIAAILAAGIATSAAFASTVPGFPRRLAYLAAIAATVWIGGLAVGAASEWGEVSLAKWSEWGCVAMIVFGGAVPAVGLAIMLRHGAPLAPALTAAMAAFAPAMLASVGACVAHPHPSDAVTLVWHGGTILVLVAAAASGGRAVLAWRTRRDSHTLEGARSGLTN